MTVEDDKAVPCGAIAFYNYGRIECTRDAGHPGIHRAVIPENGASHMQRDIRSEFMKQGEWGIAVVWKQS